MSMRPASPLADRADSIELILSLPGARAAFVRWLRHQDAPLATARLAKSPKYVLASPRAQATILRSIIDNNLLFVHFPSTTITIGRVVGSKAIVYRHLHCDG